MFITVDSNIMLSIFTKDSLYDASSSLMDKYHTHDYIINDCIYLELGVHFTNLKTLNEALDALEVVILKKAEINYQIVLSAWTTYLRKRKFVCPSCKKSINPVCPKCRQTLAYRQRILTDFFIGGFALVNSDAIMTFDPTYYKNYFPQLTILD